MSKKSLECIYWPGMSAEIKQYISACEICRELDTTSQPNEPLISHEVLSCPWERVGTDIFFLDGKEYLITIDYHRNFWEADRLLDSNASTVILELKSHYARHGIPDQVMSNNGPQFVSTEFATFVKTWEFDHLPSSPGNSNAKGKAESGVKTAKRLLREIDQCWNGSIPGFPRLQEHSHTSDDYKSCTVADGQKDQNAYPYYTKLSDAKNKPTSC